MRFNKKNNGFINDRNGYFKIGIPRLDNYFYVAIRRRNYYKLFAFR